MQGKDDQGRFISKSSDLRQVRSIRVTDEIWNKFGEQAKKRSITRADLLEEIFSQKSFDDEVIHGKISEALAILKHGITSKRQGGAYSSNNAKSLKEEVVRVIAVLEKVTKGV